ncbi:hypothetical protein ACHMW6_06505 [Pseudoduganella sp. UC29_106]|uniref:hypothetical protein n=1 Tax=Pseudoduganella sp. UC29_106 TaxID=3374553 RepID=UPI0037579453
MQFQARFFDENPSDSSLLTHVREWKIAVADDASGRELVRAAMRACAWPDVPYKVKFHQFGHWVKVEVDIAERPDQLISIMVEDVSQNFTARSFAYRAPTKSQIAQAVHTRLAMLGVFVVCLAGLLVIIPRHLWCAIANPDKAMGIAVAIDRAANGALNGDPNETVSSRAHRARLNKERWGCWLCKVLDWITKNHCRDSAGK